MVRIFQVDNVSDICVYIARRASHYNSAQLSSCYVDTNGRLRFARSDARAAWGIGPTDKGTETIRVLTMTTVLLNDFNERNSTVTH